MFYHLIGELTHTEPNAVVLDVGGVGFYLTVSTNTLSAVSQKKGEKVKLFTYLSVKEDALDLYGFYEYEELSVFRMLLSVSGVGAKSAISVLGQLTPEKFALAVTAGDAKAISKAPGVGAKTAARIILELKDKLAKTIGDQGGMRAAFASDITAAGEKPNKLTDAMNTLIVLGYQRSEALSALTGLDPDTGLEDMIRLALKKLSSM